MSQVRIMENLVYREDTGTAGMLDLYLPEGKQSKALLLFFHGGGLESGDKKDDAGIYRQLAGAGIAVASANYRMYPAARYPDYVADAAKAVAWSLSCAKAYTEWDRVFVGGISAGAYLSMMLHFAPLFLAEAGVEEKQIDGYIFDAGQPTVHFNVLRERGMDPASVRVDETAPLFYLEGECAPAPHQKFLVLVSDNDIPGRREQNELLIRTMETHRYEKAQITYRIMEGYTHAGYVGVQDAEGRYPYAVLLEEFINLN